MSAMPKQCSERPEVLLARALRKVWDLADDVLEAEDVAPLGLALEAIRELAAEALQDVTTAAVS